MSTETHHPRITAVWPSITAMALNFNSNNAPGGNKKLSQHEKLVYEPVRATVDELLYPPFPIAPDSKGILELLMLNYFSGEKEESTWSKKKTIVADYNSCMDILSDGRESSKDFDTFFVFACNKDIDPLLFSHIPNMVANKQKQDKHSTYKLIQLPYNSFSTINRSFIHAPLGVFVLQFNSKDSNLKTNSLYINIISKVPDI